MNAKPQAQTNIADNALLVLAVALVTAGVVGFYYYGTAPLVYRVGGLLVAVVLAAVAAYRTQPGINAWKYLQSSRTEVRKMVWPSREETMQTTIAVIAMVIALGVFMWLLDLLLFWAFSPITGQAGG
jgi:preprotein translocase subunit SecE